MIWREEYRTLVAEDVVLPPLDGAILDGSALEAPERFALVGAFGLRAYAEQEIWRRLLAADTDAYVITVHIAKTWPAKARSEAALVIPKSLHGKTILIEDKEGKWSTLLPQDRPTRSFAAVVKSGEAKILMLGAPTEEAWDTFKASLRAGS